MDIGQIVLQGGVIAAIVSVANTLVQKHIAASGRQHMEKLSKASLEIQSLTAHRSAATFVADKHQEWIAELRADMAHYLALSQEIAWKWHGVRVQVVEKLQGKTKEERKRILEEILEKFSIENGDRDRKHEEQAYRIRFRLNPKEYSHITLQRHMEDIRKVVKDIAKAKCDADDNTSPGNLIPDLTATNECIESLQRLMEEAAKLTEAILSSGWHRMLQGVANPETLLQSLAEQKTLES